MAPRRHELESRYDVPADLELPRLEQIPRVDAVTDPVTSDVETTYVDTPELSLTTAGITLRSSTGGADQGWLLEIPAPHGRVEVRAPLLESAVAAPESLRSVVELFLRSGDLEPLAVVRVRTAVRRVLDSRQVVLAEVHDDLVTAQTSALVGEEPAPRAWRTWEMRLAAGDLGLLTAASELVESAGGSPASPESTFRRALGGRAAASPTHLEPGPHSTATQVLRVHLLHLVRALRGVDPLVRVDAPDAVHRMRVLTRQLRSTLAAFRPLFDTEVTDPLRDELKWLAGVLGEARDAEVLRKRLLRELDEEPPEMVRGLVRGFVDRDLQDRYRAAHARCVETLHSERYLLLVERLTAASASPPWALGAADLGQDVLRDCVRRTYRRARRRVRALRGAHDEHDHARRLHEVRKAAKRLRYAVEALEPVSGKPATRLGKAMKRVQSVLGEHQDAMVTRVELRALGDRAARAGVNAFSLGLLDARQEAQAAETRDRFAHVWQRASRKRLRRWLS
jgi:CHAD domain-containing protein